MIRIPHLRNRDRPIVETCVLTQIRAATYINTEEVTSKISSLETSKFTNSVHKRNNVSLLFLITDN